MKTSTAELDRRLYRLSRGVKVLEPLDWPNSLKDAFFAGLRAGSPRNPEPPAARFTPDPELVAGLGALRDACDVQDPVGAFLQRTAQSQLDALALLEGVGTPAFAERSARLYGGPQDRIGRAGPTHLEAARVFLGRTRGFVLDPVEDTDAAAAAAWLRGALAPYFTEEPLPVELDPELSAKASAGSTRVRIRTSARFGQAGLRQLLHHEALVHSATKRNGQAQPGLSCLGLSSVRTAAVQEGLATLAELITDCMDIARLRRLALRTVAIDAALQGADFVQVYTLLRDEGQSEEEAWASAQRVFRGGDPRGGVAFTKDLIYLRGLLEVHTFLLKAIEAGRHRLPLILFAGRMTLGDALALEPLFLDGTLRMPQVCPEWVQNKECLAAYLVWSAFNDQAGLSGLRLEDLGD